MSDPVLDIQGLSLGFRVEREWHEVLHQVDVALERGAVHALVGESGSGKSTLALACMGLLPPNGRIFAGSISFAGHELTQLKPRIHRGLRGTKLAMVFQDPMTALTPWMTVGAQLAEGLRRRGVTKRKDIQREGIALLERVGIPMASEKFNSFPHEFSGGQRQRICIAIALAGEPEVLFADEPTTALDVTVQAQVLGLLKDLQAERDLTVLLVTHDMGVVAAIGDVVSVLKSGHLMEHGAIESVFAAPESTYTRSLLDAVPKMPQ